MVAFGQKLRYFADLNGPKEGPHENEFWLFSYSEMNITNRVEKVDEKNEVICLVFTFPSWVMILKSNSIKATYVYIYILLYCSYIYNLHIYTIYIYNPTLVKNSSFTLLEIKSDAMLGKLSLSHID